MPSKTVTLKLSKQDVKIVLAALGRDETSDWIGKNTRLPWERVFDLVDEIEEQLKGQGT